MTKVSHLTPQASELLRFIVPQPPVFTATLPDPENPITQRYEYYDGSPATIVMYETNGNDSTFRYTFRLEERALIVESCTETTASGQSKEHPAGYVYLRRPLSKAKPEEWEYLLPDDVRVVCISRLMQQPIGGKLHEIIHLSRLYYYPERKKGKPNMIVEQYVADYGIRQKMVLSDMKLK